MLADGEFVSDADLHGIMRQQGAYGAPDAVPPEPAMGPPPPAPLIEIERAHIVRTLSQVRGNKAVAARLLGVSRRALYRQLERHGLHTAVHLVRDDVPAVAMGRPS
jgi:transcriptional regulator of acetoin/glycerol metabolism